MKQKSQKEATCRQGIITINNKLDDLLEINNHDRKYFGK